MKQKTCRICHERKDLCDFYAYTKSSDGLQSKCKSCDNLLRAKNLKKSRDKFKDIMDSKKK